MQPAGRISSLCNGTYCPPPRWLSAFAAHEYLLIPTRSSRRQILLAFNHVHYESLVPCTVDDASSQVISFVFSTAYNCTNPNQASDDDQSSLSSDGSCTPPQVHTLLLSCLLHVLVQLLIRFDMPTNRMTRVPYHPRCTPPATFCKKETSFSIQKSSKTILPHLATSRNAGCSGILYACAIMCLIVCVLVDCVFWPPHTCVFWPTHTCGRCCYRVWVDNDNPLPTLHACKSK